MPDRDEQALHQLSNAADERDQAHVADPANAPPMYCRKCLYDLRGTASDQCPECGCYFHPRQRLSYTTIGHQERRQRRREMWIPLGIFAVLMPICIIGTQLLAQWGEPFITYEKAACLVFIAFLWLLLFTPVGRIQDRAEAAKKEQAKQRN